MAFTINAYSTKSDNNHVEKVFTLKAQITGTLREPCSILKPEIVIERPTAPTDWTHIFILSFNARWYYINNIVSVGKYLWQLSCSVDVLETYHGSRDDETMLYGCTGIIARNEAASDPTLTDTALPIQHNINMQKITSTTYGANTWISSDYLLSNYPGETGVTRYQIMYSLAGYNSNNVYVDEAYPQSFVTLDLSTYKDCVKFAIEQNAILMEKPITDYVLKSFWLPFNVPKGSQKIKTMKVPGGADFLFNDPGASVLATGMWSGEWKIVLPAETTYKYKNFAPYRDVYIEFLPFGRIRLDNAVLFSAAGTNVNLYIKVKCNPATGDAILSYYTDNFPEQFVAQSNVAIGLPFTSNMINYGQIAGGVASTIVSTAMAIGSAAEGNIAGAIAGGASVLSGMQSLTNAGRSSSVGALAGAYVSMKPIAYIYDNTVNANARNNNLLGMPLYESKKIANVYGYAEITNIHLEGFTATAAEKNELLTILSGGVVFDNAP